MIGWALLKWYAEAQGHTSAPGFWHPQKRISGIESTDVLLLLLTEKDPEALEKRNGNNEQINPENKCWHVSSYQMEHFLHLCDKEIEDRTPSNISQKQNLKKGT